MKEDDKGRLLRPVPTVTKTEKKRKKKRKRKEKKKKPKTSNSFLNFFFKSLSYSFLCSFFLLFASFTSSSFPIPSYTRFDSSSFFQPDGRLVRPAARAWRTVAGRAFPNATHGGSGAACRPGRQRGPAAHHLLPRPGPALSVCSACCCPWFLVLFLYFLYFVYLVYFLCSLFLHFLYLSS